MSDDYPQVRIVNRGFGSCKGEVLKVLRKLRDDFAARTNAPFALFVKGEGRNDLYFEGLEPHQLVDVAFGLLQHAASSIEADLPRCCASHRDLYLKVAGAARQCEAIIAGVAGVSHRRHA